MTDIERLADAILRLTESDSGCVSIKAQGGGATINIHLNLTVHTAPQMWKPTFALFRSKLLRLDKHSARP